MITDCMPRLTPVIDRVTITGADDSIKPSDLISLTNDYPFVEWAILASENNTCKSNGTNRYPSPKWIDELQSISDGLSRLALHINGRWVRQLLLGNNIIPAILFEKFRRVQLNFHAAREKCDPVGFAKSLKQIDRIFIFQFDGVSGNKYMASAIENNVQDCYPLFDASGGAGILPSSWPKPQFRITIDDKQYWDYHGYAGGLGPDNLIAQLPLILKAASSTDDVFARSIWVDMETKVRSRDDKTFDLDKVRRCLEICAPYTAI